MNKKIAVTQSPALAYIQSAWDGIPRGSFDRLNRGMRTALQNAVETGMRFDLEDLSELDAKNRLTRWIGSDYERFYSAACSGRSTQNPSFCMAYEKWVGRKPFLWPEATKTPERLCVGAQFHWQGLRVTVTSFSGHEPCLTACTYKDLPPNFEVGALYYLDGEYRRIEAIAHSDAEQLMVRYSKPAKEDLSRQIDRRFKISLDELKASRKAFDTKRGAYVKEMEAATTLEALEEIHTRVKGEVRGAFRHFDIEDLQAAYAAADKRIKELMSPPEREEAYARIEAGTAADLQRWMAGEDVTRYFEEVRLRVKGEWVETSTGQQATVKGVRRALEFIRQYRADGFHGKQVSFDVDAFPLTEINREGVKVGCTFVPMEEVDRIAGLV